MIITNLLSWRNMTDQINCQKCVQIQKCFEVQIAEILYTLSSFVYDVLVYMYFNSHA